MSQEKQNAARTAVDQIEDGMMVGLGTGSTAAFAISYLGEKVRSGLTISAIPTSEASKKQAQSEGIPLIDFETSPSIDLCIDGADEIDSELNMIKGGGGALLREKIVASSAKLYLIIIDSSKQVETLGTFPLPVEVIPFGWEVTRRQLAQFGGVPNLRQREGKPFVTDQGHYIIDCALSQIEDAPKLNHQLNQLPGVVENGLFVDMTDRLIIGSPDGITEKHKN